MSRSKPRRYALLLAALAIFVSDAGLAADAPSSNVIEFHMELRRPGGVVRCGLFTKAGWLQKPLASDTVKAATKKARCTFSKIAPGAYGISAFHDVNENGKLDTNLVGYPVEEYGASHNARNLFSAPSFEDARFQYKGGRKALTAQLK